MRAHLLTLLVLAGCPALARAQEAVPAPPLVRHAPRNETGDGVLALHFETGAIDTVGAIVVRYRAHDAPTRGRFAEVVARRDLAGGTEAWVAEIPPEAVVAPSVDYYVVARAPGRRELAVFASAAHPHAVVVVETPDRWHERDQRRLTNGHRSRVSVLGEWIDYGDWLRPGPSGAVQNNIDRYFHSEVSYAYGMFGAVEWLRFSIGVLRGSYGIADGSVNNDVGLYTGAAEITWYAVTWFRVKTQLLFGISQTGFAAGATGALIFGRDGDTQLTLAGGGIAPNVGASGSVRLSWNSIPSVPMAATVEVSSLPGGDRAGVRLLVEAGYRIEPGTVIKVWGGYQARTQVVGGPTVGLELVIGL